MTMILEGIDQKKIADEVGITQQTIYQWKQQREFQEAFKKMQETLEEEVRSVMSTKLQQEAPQSLDTVVALRDGAKQERVRLDAASRVIDWAGYKAVDRSIAVQVHAVTPELLAAIKALVKEEDVIDAVPVGGVTELPERTS
jgi:hypothetical protein